MKAITYGQMRDAINKLIESGDRRANEPMMLNGSYWRSVVDSRGDRLIVLGKVEVRVPPPHRIRLV